EPPGHHPRVAGQAGPHHPRHAGQPDQPRGPRHRRFLMAGQMGMRASAAGAKLAGVTGDDPKAELHRYLTRAREALLWKLDGLSEYDVRRPLVPTGTNLLGLVKHVASVAAGYFGDTFGRPFGEPLPWLEETAENNADMWATPDESREDIIGL